MAWEGIEERLKKNLTVKVSFPAGTIWLPSAYLSVDDWLTSMAQTDEELRELNMPRMSFLQNRWPIEPLLELEWDSEFSDRRAVLAMNVRRRAYILFSGWNEYQIIGAVEPKNKPSLYRALLVKLLENPHFVPTKPTHIRNHRPDLVGDLGEVSLESRTGKKAKDRQLFALEKRGGFTRRADSKHPLSKPQEGWRSFLTEILEGWIGRWLDLPEMGFWHEDTPESISSWRTGENRDELQTKPAKTNGKILPTSVKEKSSIRAGKLRGRKGPRPRQK